MVGIPMPNPTDRAMMSPVSSPELEPALGLAVALVPVRLPLLPPLLLVPLFEVLVSVGTELAAVVELALPLSPEDPVATAASADTTAVVVLLGCGLFAAG